MASGLNLKGGTPLGLAERVVWSMPFLLNAAASVRGWQFLRARYGSVYKQTVAEILERDHWSTEQINDYQRQKLRKLISHASQHVPYYRDMFREHGFSIEDFQCVEDLAKMPILEKDAVRQDPLRFVDDRLDHTKLIAERTSGTTGVPVRLYLTKESLQMNYAFFEARCRRMAGMEFRKQPYAMFGPRTVVPQTRTKPPFWCYNYAWKQLYMSVFHLSEQFLPAYVEELRKRPYHAIMGFPSSLYLLAQLTLAHKEKPLRFETAITSGELLFPEHRETIERAFGCRVFDQYGCSENCVFASQCPEGSMHISPDFGVLEVVDDQGNQLPAGQAGQIICTGLLNFGQVLIRYRVGDRGAISTGTCSCGRPLPVLESLDGRSGDCFILEDGRKVYRLSSLLAGIQTVARWQVVQDDIGIFRVRVVPDSGFSEKDAALIKSNLSSDLGNVRVEVEQVNDIERSKGGKVNLFVCNVPKAKVDALLGKTSV